MRYIVALLLSTVVAHYPKDDSVNFTEWTQPRPGVHTGYGPVVDDLESMTSPNHDMRNTGDIGNWVHELTHHLNSQCRTIVTKMKGRDYNCFYVMEKKFVSLPEPNTTLREVAPMVPDNERKESYRPYLIHQQRWWNEQPLYILDEASAAANALYYQVWAGEVDLKRETLAYEWTCYSNALVRAVEKHDPNYDNLSKLRAFVDWHNRRIKYLVQLHKNLRDPSVPKPKPYQIW